MHPGVGPGLLHKDNTLAFSVSNRYTNQVLDEDTGLYYYGARYYDPKLARFTQPDTIVPDPGSSQALNRYSYTYNNPLVFTDPTGNIGVMEAMLIGMMLGMGGAAIAAGATGQNVGRAMAAAAVLSAFSIAGFAASGFVGAAACAAAGGTLSAVITGGDPLISAATAAGMSLASSALFGGESGGTGGAGDVKQAAIQNAATSGGMPGISGMAVRMISVLIPGATKAGATSVATSEALAMFNDGVDFLLNLKEHLLDSGGALVKSAGIEGLTWSNVEGVQLPSAFLKSFRGGTEAVTYLLVEDFFEIIKPTLDVIKGRVGPSTNAALELGTTDSAFHTAKQRWFLLEGAGVVHRSSLNYYHIGYGIAHHRNSWLFRLANPTSYAGVPIDSGLTPVNVIVAWKRWQYSHWPTANDLKFGIAGYHGYHAERLQKGISTLKGQ